jgi:hypothetical protein
MYTPRSREPYRPGPRFGNFLGGVTGGGSSRFVADYPGRTRFLSSSITVPQLSFEEGTTLVFLEAAPTQRSQATSS